MEPVPTVEQDLVEKAVRPPALCPEGDGHRLSEIVQLPDGKKISFCNNKKIAKEKLFLK